MSDKRKQAQLETLPDLHLKVHVEARLAGLSAKSFLSAILAYHFNLSPKLQSQIVAEGEKLTARAGHHAKAS